MTKRALQARGLSLFWLGVAILGLTGAHVWLALMAHRTALPGGALLAAAIFGLLLLALGVVGLAQPPVVAEAERGC